MFTHVFTHKYPSLSCIARWTGAMWSEQAYQKVQHCNQGLKTRISRLSLTIWWPLMVITIMQLSALYGYKYTVINTSKLIMIISSFLESNKLFLGVCNLKHVSLGERTPKQWHLFTNILHTLPHMLYCYMVITFTATHEFSCQVMYERQSQCTISMVYRKTSA